MSRWAWGTLKHRSVQSIGGGSVRSVPKKHNGGNKALAKLDPHVLPLTLALYLLLS